MSKDDEILRIALELKQKDEIDAIEKSVLNEEGISTEYLKRASKIYKQKEKKKKRLINTGLTVFGVIVVILLSFLVQQFTSGPKPAVTEFGVSVERGKYLPDDITVTPGADNSFFFHAALKGIPKGLLLMAECRLKSSQGGALIKQNVSMKTKDKQVHLLICPFTSEDPLQPGEYSVEITLNASNTGGDSSPFKTQTFGKFPFTLLKAEPKK